MSLAKQEIDPTEFAAWACGSINSNLKRAMLAEFIVAKALGCSHKYHEEWNAFDLEYEEARIEVKSSGYGTPPFLATKLAPKPRFDIRKRSAAWSNRENSFVYEGDPTRHSDLYVFAATLGNSVASFKPFCVDEWEFYVASTQLLDTEFSDQKTISATTLKDRFGRVGFDVLKSKVDEILGGNAQ